MASKESFDLERFVPFLVNRVSARIASDFVRQSRQKGIRYRMWRVLLALWHYGEMRPIDISQRTNIEISTLSRILVQMNSTGLIEKKKANKESRGQTIAKLAGKGAACVDDLLPLYQRTEEAALVGLSEGERMILVEILTKMFINLSDK